MSTQATTHMPLTAGPLYSAYQQLAAEGMITPDANQQPVVAALTQLLNQLGAARPSGMLQWFKKTKQTGQPQSLYIYGGVGRGKSMLMDLFYDALPPAIRKRRVHFHRFMLDVHQQLHQLRQQSEADAMHTLIHLIAQQQRVLCFDELQATDVADASLITRLIEGLLEQGVTVVATSNRPPAQLYQGEVQKERFERLTRFIHQHFNVMQLGGAVDYRKQQVQSLQTTYITPLGSTADKEITDILHHLSPLHHQEITTLEVQGRQLPLKTFGEKILLAGFEELCAQALGAADYLAIAAEFEVVILKNIPLLGPENRNEAKRFVTLIDALYEHKVMLICSASAPPAQLYPKGHGSFEFERTASRLMEMQSAAYIQRPHI